MEPTIEVVREKSTNDGTPGLLTVLKTNWQCSSLELPWRNNRRGTSCIIPGDYIAWVWFSPTLNRHVIRLEDKNGRKDCLIHNGNWAGDVEQGEKTQVHGCTEVGRGYADLELPDHSGRQRGILNSVVELEALLKELDAHVGPG